MPWLPSTGFRESASGWSLGAKMAPDLMSYARAVRWRLFGLGLVAMWIAACGDDFVEEEPATTELPCAIRVFLVERCATCHGAEPKFGAPMPLVTREDLLSAPLDGEGTIAERMVLLMSADQGRMPPPPEDAATETEIERIEQWIADGVPEAPDDEHCDIEPHGGAGGSPVSCTPDLQLTGAEPFEMPSSSIDEQVCFGISLPATADERHITAIVPRVDNDKILHHILVMQSPTPVSPEPVSCAFLSLDWKLLYAWGPGTPAQELPEVAGFPYGGDEETHFVLQVHYNNLLGLEGETDQSGIEFCTTGDLREHDADVMAFGGVQFQGITAGVKSELSCQTDLPPELSIFLPVNIVQSWPHMHELGHAFRSWIDHADGSSTTLVDMHDYDFFHQATYPSPATLGAGDTFHTHCTWENDTGQDVGFGEGTADEMCFNFVTYYPRIDVPNWNWIVPSLISSCEMQRVP